MYIIHIHHVLYIVLIGECYKVSVFSFSGSPVSERPSGKEVDSAKGNWSGCERTVKIVFPVLHGEM